MHACMHARTHARTHEHTHTHYSVCQHLSAMPRSGEAVPVLAVCCGERALVTVANWPCEHPAAAAAIARVFRGAGGSLQ